MMRKNISFLLLFLIILSTSANVPNDDNSNKQSLYYLMWVTDLLLNETNPFGIKNGEPVQVYFNFSRIVDIYDNTSGYMTTYHYNDLFNITIGQNYYNLYTSEIASYYIDTSEYLPMDWKYDLFVIYKSVRYKFWEGYLPVPLNTNPNNQCKPLPKSTHNIDGFECNNTITEKYLTIGYTSIEQVTFDPENSNSGRLDFSVNILLVLCLTFAFKKMKNYGKY